MTRRLFRASVFHAPRNPFRESHALEVYSDGGLLVEDAHILACGDFATLAKANPSAEIHDWRGSFLLPGFVDTHVHFPQIRIIGALGEPLLDWLKHTALPEEARMADATYARLIAREFLRALARHGTTTALVFGAHFEPAMQTFFEEAGASGLRIASGLIIADCNLLPQLHITPDAAYKQSNALIQRYHAKGLLSYAVTPRFALSSSEAMLEVCGSLMAETPGLLFQTHLNENQEEVQAVAKNFPAAIDYLAVYEKFGLVGMRSVLAHNVHATDSELQRLAAGGATVAHCPASNASLGSGLFPMTRHVSAGVRFALGSDVGAGTGFGMLKEGLQAYLMQRLCPNGYELTPAHLLYLSTGAGAEALGANAGNFAPGRSADFVRIQAPEGSVLEAVRKNAESAERMLAAIFTLAGAESIVSTWVAGCQV